MYITVNKLKKMKACHSKIDLFKDVFGDKCLINDKNIDIAMKNGLDVTFVINEETVNAFLKTKKLRDINRPIEDFIKGNEVKIREDANIIGDIWPGWVPEMDRHLGKIREINSKIHTVWLSNMEIGYVRITIGGWAFTAPMLVPKEEW